MNAVVVEALCYGLVIYDVYDESVSVCRCTLASAYTLLSCNGFVMFLINVFIFHFFTLFNIKFICE